MRPGMVFGVDEWESRTNSDLKLFEGDAGDCYRVLSVQFAWRFSA